MSHAHLARVRGLVVTGQSEEERETLADKVDAWFFAISGLIAAWYAYVLFRDGVRPGWPTLLLLVFWIYVTYLVLPRLHRILTGLYLPGYFIGRTRTSDGLLGDPVNLALHGSEEQLHAAMTSAGWTRADQLTMRTGTAIVKNTLGRRSYASAPVSPLHLFDRRQDFAYEQQVAGSPARRHHVRFWRCPDDWLLPGGFAVDWLAAATYDRSVGLSLFTLQITHKIDENTDVERDFVVASVTAAEPRAELVVLENFSSGYHSRNGGGDRIRTDGDLPVLDLRQVPEADGVLVAEPASGRKRPASTIAGAGIALIRSLAYIGLIVVLLASPRDTTYFADFGLSPDDLEQLEVVLAASLIVAIVIGAGLAFAILAGRNWARLMLMVVCTLTAIAAFIATIGRTGHPVGVGSLPSLGGSVLVLLALSTPSARAWATGRTAHTTTDRTTGGPSGLAPAAAS